MTSEIIITIISGILIVLGTLGAILPFLPGLPLSYGGLLLYLFFGRSINVSMSDIWGLIIFSVLILLSILVDVFAPAIAAKGHKASVSGVWGVIIGGVLGIMILGPVGILLGPFVGAFIGEMIHEQNPKPAWRVALASMLGLVIGSVFKLVVGISMFIYFLVLVF